MTITIDGSGRLVLPTEIRRQAGIRPNSRLEMRFRDGSARLWQELHLSELASDESFLRIVGE